MLLPESSFGPLHHAHACRELDRQDEARRILAGAVERFPDDWRVNYAFACACGKLGDQLTALRHLERAIERSGENDIRLMALNEPDLRAVWADISEI